MFKFNIILWSIDSTLVSAKATKFTSLQNYLRFLMNNFLNCNMHVWFKQKISCEHAFLCTTNIFIETFGCMYLFQFHFKQLRNSLCPKKWFAIVCSLKECILHTALQLQKFVVCIFSLSKHIHILIGKYWRIFTLQMELQISNKQKNIFNTLGLYIEGSQPLWYQPLISG